MRALLLVPALALSGCVLGTVADTAASVASTVVVTTAEVGAAVVTAPARVLGGGADGGRHGDDDG